MSEVKEIGVALLGLGNVGAGVVKLLEENAVALEARLGARLAVRAIAVRALSKKKRLVEVDRALLTTDLAATIRRPDVDIVCELIGGTDEARTAILGAIAHGKHVVTANKAVLAEHGREIFAAAQAHGVDVYFEPAVCGGVPIIRVLREGLASDRVESFLGIVNGTSNYILSTMAEAGRPFDAVLKEAQDLGYAEADPTLDVGGGDAAHKLAILVMLCFGTFVDVKAIPREGIDSLDPIDFEYAEKFGYVIKPLVIGREHPHGIEARVHPAMIPANWLLADVPGAKNALYVQSYALGPSMYYGAGAGMMPTAMAAVSDMIEISRNIQAGRAGAAPTRAHRPLVDKPLLPIGDIRSRYYLRFGVLDQPGVLGQITTILGAHGVSIAQVVQDSPREAEAKRGAPADAAGTVFRGPVRVFVLTHEARERDVQGALEKIAALPVVAEKARLVRIAGGTVIHEYQIIFGDTDQMGVVYYANYLRFFEGSRAAYWRACGRTHKDLDDWGVALPVVEAQCRYRKPARYEDVLQIHVEVAEMRGASMRFEYLVTRGNDLLAEGFTRHAVIGIDGRPKALPPALRDAIPRIASPTTTGPR